MRRRDFLIASARTAGFLAVPMALRSWASELPDGAGTRTDWKSAVAEVEKQLPALMEAASIPGVSIAIIHHAKVAWRRGFGFKDAAAKLPVDVDTIFEAASMSKPVFAYAVMKLCEKGVMNLDTPLTKYTTERFLQGDPRLDLITARHVLSHTSGFQNWRSDHEPLKIHFAPGEKYQYSGEGYSYLQSVVEKVTGQAIEPYMTANLFVPFGMKSSGYVWNEMFETRMARPHDVHGKPEENKKSTPADVARYGSAGALLTTPTDYARFLIEVIDPKPRDAFRLSRASLAEMLRPQVKVIEAPEYTIWWGLGWRLAHAKVGDSIGHGGDNKGFHCIAAASVNKRSGVVLMTNGENGGKFIAELFAGELMKPFL